MARSATDTRERILKMSRNLLSVHGCEGTSINDIITAVGMTKGAFYHHFRSKEALCEAVIDRAVEEYHALAAVIDEQARPIDQLRTLLDRLADLNASGQWVNCRLMIRLLGESRETHPNIRRKLQDFWQWYESFFVELIQQCRRAGQLADKPDAATQGRILLHMMAGSVLFGTTTRDQTHTTGLSQNIIAAIQFS